MAFPKDGFFAKMEELGIALTYDDVRLRTGYGNVRPSKTNTTATFSRNISLKIPIVSAAMDTVTESSMAIALAKLGGIGVIHKNLKPEEQAREVAKVKYHLHGVIERPICVRESQTVAEILQMKEEKGYSFDSFPVIDDQEKLVGVLTGNDFTFCDNQALCARDIMTKEVIVGTPETTPDQAYEAMQDHKVKLLPLIDKENKIVGLYTFKDLKAIRSGSSAVYNVDGKGRLRVAAAIGVGEDAVARTALLVERNVDAVVIDVAHADSDAVVMTLQEIKKRYKIDVVVGNISEADSAKRLLDAGADGIKVGQGPGSICTTRIIAGIGCPQVTAVYQCASVARNYGVPICADGGIRYSGDITIAIGAGADCVMLGNMLAGTDEAPGMIEFYKGRQWKSYRGMGSLGAMQHEGSRERYRQEGTVLVPEGVEGMVAYKGALRQVIAQLIGGLQRGMAYVGAGTIEELQEKADFIRITNAGSAESHPHDIQITKEAPNYSPDE